MWWTWSIKAHSSPKVPVTQRDEWLGSSSVNYHVSLSQNMCFQEKEKIGTGSKTIYDYHSTKTSQKGTLLWMIWRWSSSNNDSHHSFIWHLLAPIMCENLYWALEYGIDETLDLPNDVYTGDRQFQSCGKCSVRRNTDAYMKQRVENGVWKSPVHPGK